MSQLDTDLLNKAFLKAVRSGDLAVAKEKLAAGASIHAHGLDGGYALHWAIRNGDLVMTQFLVVNGANIEAPEPRGDTPLIVAVCFDKPELVKALLGWKAEINARNYCGCTALSYAVENTEVLNIVLTAGADINTRDGKGRTPLMLAIEKGEEEAIRILLAARANPDIQDMEGNTALVYALSHKDPISAVRLADAGADINLENDKGLTPADHAVFYGMGHLVEDLKKQALERELSGFKKGLSRPLKAGKPFRPR